MLRLILGLIVFGGILILLPIVIMLNRRINNAITFLFVLYAILTISENMFRSIMIFVILYVIKGTVKDIKARFNDKPKNISEEIEEESLNSNEYWTKITILDAEEKVGITKIR